MPIKSFIRPAAESEEDPFKQDGRVSSLVVTAASMTNQDAEGEGEDDEDCNAIDDTDEYST